MKILYVFDYFSPTHGGGTVALIYQLITALVQKGHDVVLYTSDYERDQEYVDTLKGAKIKLYHCLSSFFGFYFMPEMIKDTRKELRDYDVIHLHTMRSFQNIIIHRYAKKYGIPYIIDAHGSAPRAFMGEKGLKWVLKWIYDVIFGYAIFKGASRAIAETEVGIKEYKDLGMIPYNITMITPPFPIEDFSDLPQSGIFRKKYGLPKKKIIMFLGRIHWIKGIDFLVDSFFELSKIREDVMLVVIGPDDGFKKSLEDQIDRLNIKNLVIFTGLLVGRDKLSALVDADVLIQTSRYEQGAWAPFEAILCGTPIIVSNNSGAGEDVKKFEAGYLVDWGNSIELRDTIQEILTNPEGAKKKTDKAKQYIINNLSMTKNVGSYEKLYKECLKQKRQG